VCTGSIGPRLPKWDDVRQYLAPHRSHTTLLAPARPEERSRYHNWAATTAARKSIASTSVPIGSLIQVRASQVHSNGSSEINSHKSSDNLERHCQ